MALVVVQGYLPQGAGEDSAPPLETTFLALLQDGECFHAVCGTTDDGLEKTVAIRTRTDLLPPVFQRTMTSGLTFNRPRAQAVPPGPVFSNRPEEEQRRPPLYPGRVTSAT